MAYDSKLAACERALAAAVERATLFEVAHNTLKEQLDALRAEVAERTFDLKRALEGIDHLRAEVEALKARQQPQDDDVLHQCPKCGARFEKWASVRKDMLAKSDLSAREHSAAVAALVEEARAVCNDFDEQAEMVGEQGGYGYLPEPTLIKALRTALSAVERENGGGKCAT